MMSSDQQADNEYDVAIVGAGPAGATCARSLTALGVGRVALIDRSKFPRDKSCGDGIGPGAVNVMESLGIQQCLSGHRKIETIAVSSPGGIEVSGPLPQIGGTQPVGYVIPRKIFDNYLFEAAIQGGASDFTGMEFEDAEFVKSTQQWRLQLAGTQITAKVLVGADGARSKVRRILNVPSNTDENTGIGIRVYVTADGSVSQSLRLDFVRALLPAYGWVFPIDNSQANVGVGIDLSAYKAQRRHLDELLASYLSTGEERSAFRADGESSLTAILPYGSELPRLAHPSSNAALIGDAGSMINPFTGEGIFYGMFAGQILARRIARGFAGNRIQVALHDYEREFRDRFEKHFQTNWTMKRATGVAKWCDLVIGACKKDPKILGELIDLMMGDKKQMSSSTILNIVRRSWLPF
jgi:geranylgeranyl reductase family protein